MNKNLVSISPLETNGTTGLVADLKTFLVWKCYGVGVATELIAANSQWEGSIVRSSQWKGSIVSNSQWEGSLVSNIPWGGGGT